MNMFQFCKLKKKKPQYKCYENKPTENVVVILDDRITHPQSSLLNTGQQDPGPLRWGCCIL